MEVTDGVSAGRREMSIKDWTTNFDGSDHDGFMTMTVEFSKTKLEKCIELPEIVCFFFNVSTQ